MFTKPNFEDQILEIFILIEENNMHSTVKAVKQYQILHQRETGENLSLVKANEEMRKSYEAWLKKDYKMSK